MLRILLAGFLSLFAVIGNAQIQIGSGNLFFKVGDENYTLYLPEGFCKTIGGHWLQQRKVDLKKIPQTNFVSVFTTCEIETGKEANGWILSFHKPFRGTQYDMNNSLLQQLSSDEFWDDIQKKSHEIRPDLMTPNKPVVMLANDKAIAVSVKQFINGENGEIIETIAVSAQIARRGNALFGYLQMRLDVYSEDEINALSDAWVEAFSSIE